MTLEGLQKETRAVTFERRGYRMGWEPCTGTVFGLLQEWAVQSNPSSLSLFPQRLHRGLMLLTSFSYCSRNFRPLGTLCVCVSEIKGRVWEMCFLLYVPAWEALPQCLFSSYHPRPWEINCFLPIWVGPGSLGLTSWAKGEMLALPIAQVTLAHWWWLIAKDRELWNGVFWFWHLVSEMHCGQSK